MEGEIVGYSCASQIHKRSAYRHAAELTVCVRKGFERRGIGRRLCEPLVQHLKAEGCHVRVAAISLPNEGSVGLHERLGFNKMAHVSQVGRKFRPWVDVGHGQRGFEGHGVRQE